MGDAAHAEGTVAFVLPAAPLGEDVAELVGGSGFLEGRVCDQVLPGDGAAAAAKAGDGRREGQDGKVKASTLHGGTPGGSEAGCDLPLDIVSPGRGRKTTLPAGGLSGDQIWLIRLKNARRGQNVDSAGRSVRVTILGETPCSRDDEYNSSSLFTAAGCVPPFSVEQRRGTILGFLAQRVSGSSRMTARTLQSDEPQISHTVLLTAQHLFF